MQRTEGPGQQVLGLRVGELVEVRSEAEILATLDGRGELESLPFMPEMLQFCGRRFRVDKLAVKLCDTIGSTGMYRMRNAVHLEGLRCDGQAHGGCQAGCLLYWKEAWLRRVPSDGREPAGPPPSPRRSACSPRWWRRPARPGAGPPAEELFSCQATELLRAAPERVPSWDVSQYVLDVGRATPACSLRSAPSPSGCSTSTRTSAAGSCRGHCGSGAEHGCPSSTGSWRRPRTARSTCNPGNWCGSGARKQIISTLDGNNSNRGLSFDPEMLWYCGRQARVLRRVERIVDERTGKLLRLKRPCIVLEGVTCRGAYHRCCPRADYPYWREIWLERVG